MEADEGSTADYEERLPSEGWLLIGSFFAVLAILLSIGSLLTDQYEASREESAIEQRRLDAERRDEILSPIREAEAVRAERESRVASLVADLEEKTSVLDRRLTQGECFELGGELQRDQGLPATCRFWLLYSSGCVPVGVIEPISASSCEFPIDTEIEQDLPLPDSVFTGSRDLDCSDISGTVRIFGSDPHGFDRDGDGVGCEANG